jgi:hypothetical protein
MSGWTWTVVGDLALENTKAADPLSGSAAWRVPVREWSHVSGGLQERGPRKVAASAVSGRTPPLAMRKVGATKRDRIAVQSLVEYISMSHLLEESSGARRQ